MQKTSLLSGSFYRIFLACLFIVCVDGTTNLFGQISANFTANVRSGCSPLAVQFTDLSTTTANTIYQWDLGNGNTSTFPDAFAIYTNPGTYTVRLTITDTLTSAVSVREEVAYITVFNDPQADFDADVYNGCAPLTVNFTDLSVAGGGTINSWLWDFGDGNISTTQNPSHTYTSEGVYDVTLVVEDDNGCNHIYTAYDFINTSSVADIDFSADQPNACNAPHTVNFTPTVNPPAGTYNYLWDFGDGNTSTVETPSHTYIANGTYDVTLTVSDANGCSAVETKTTFIEIDNPIAAFTLSGTNACVGQSVDFFNNSTGADSYSWTFGDGNTSNVASPSHTYLSPGTYTVSLTATNSAFGCNDLVVQTNVITVAPSPSVNFNANNRVSCAVPHTVDFTDNSIGAVSWQWDFGDGNTSNAQNPTHTYLAGGNYTVSLTATNTDGCSATETKTSFVRITRPQADFIAGPRTNGCIPLTVNFTDISTAIEPINTYIWNFGDGTTGTGANPSHTYTTEGQFNVSLTIITQNGCRDTIVYPALIEAGIRPVVDFNANPRVSCSGNPIDFTDQSSTGTSWSWIYGDGQGSFVQSPTYTYQDTGIFDVTLIVENFGCYDTLTRDSFITIIGPISDFEMTPDQACEIPATITFTDQSISADQWLWDFGDGNTSTQQNPIHTYTAAGLYRVELLVTETATGCTHLSAQNIEVTNPIANFSANPRFGCTGLTVNFNNSSQNATSYFWDFGDGNTSTAENPAHTFNDPGIYDIMLVSTVGTCSDTLIRSGYVEVVGPTPDFSVSATDGCAPFAVNFTDLSTAVPGRSIVGRLWDFGDGGTSTAVNPSHTYADSGLYTVSLTVLDSEGCLATITYTDIIDASSPFANFTSNDTIVCPGSFVQFQSLSVGTGLTHFWQFSDGTTSNAINPIKQFPANATYSVSLTVTDGNGCTDVMARTDYISVGQPSAMFTADTTSADCPPLTVNFIDQSSADVTTWEWDFGDGSTSTLPNPSKVYSTAGDYDVRLIVTTVQGCRDTLLIDDMIQISGPTGSFDFTPKEGCNPLEVTFTGSGAGIVQYTWDFGDGTGGIGQTINHTYITDTTARPVLLARDANGCEVAITSTDSVVVRPLPIPSFAVNYSDICLGQIANFSNTTVSERPVVAWFWDFGDGTTSTSQNPTHTYTTPDTFDVTLEATTVDGCIVSTVTPVVITVTQPPVASFTATPTAGCVPYSVSFSESATGSFPIVDWHWDFGDGDTANGQVITPHMYDSAGVYTATLTVTDDEGCTGTVSRIITVHELPSTDFSANRLGCAPKNVLFTDLTTGPAPALSWFWDFGDGGATSTAQNPTHTYANDGLYTVSLTVTDANGCTFTRTKTNYVKLSHPVAEFSSTAGATCPPQSVQFTDLSVPDTTITWMWDFGDGSTSTAQNPVHTYYDEGTFDVTLIITNVFGCTDTIVKPDHVRTYVRPASSFTVSDTAVCAPTSVSFATTSTPGDTAISAYLWDYGNGINGTTPTTSFLYTTPGTYQSSLVVVDQNGCRDTSYQTITVNSIPDANFRALDTIGCAVANIDFVDMSTGANPLNNWSWTFGDGGTGSVQNPTYTYLNDGLYTVKLVVSDVNGCTDSLTRTNYIHLDHPEANFTISSPTSCPGSPLSFTDISTGITNIVGWDWDFGDGNTSTAQNPSHTYATPGSYDITLIVFDQSGCSDTLTQTGAVSVYTAPTTNFSMSTILGCEPLSVDFTDASVDGDAAVIGWSWDFGDGGNSPAQNPNYVFTTAGVYTITLTTTDANGCTSFSQNTVTVLETPTVDFVADRTASCSPVAINFSDITTSPYTTTSWEWDFGDGGTSTAQFPSYTYMADGLYDVKLVVTDQNGCTDSLTKSNYIRLDHPEADFTLDATEVCPGIPIGVTFTDTSVPDTTLQSWLWDFGDGTTSTLQNPSHSYGSPGTYSVSLTVTNVLNCTDTEIKNSLIEVRNPPNTGFTASTTSGCMPLDVDFTDISTDGDAAIVDWSWDFGTGDVSPLQNPSYQFTAAGMYDVILTTTDANGCYSSDTLQIEVLGLPAVDFNASARVGCSPQLINFTDLTTGPANLTNWVWTFGDGTGANVTNPSHTYLADGSYDVSLVVTDVNGCQDSVNRTSYIRLSHPQADFSFNVNQVCPNEPIGVTFTDQSVPDTTIATWNWDFGDGNTSTSQNPSHSYTTPGFYTITLVVTNVLGCSDTHVITNAIEVLNPPTTSFTVSDNADCVPFGVSFTQTAVAGDAAIVNWVWDFGDGTGSLLQNPSYVYTTPGVYTVTLTTTDANGCSTTATQTVEGYELPVADFDANQGVGCSSANITFTDLSTGPATINSWFWTFGDGGTATVTNPTHNYIADGNYNVSLSVTDANGCSGTRVKNQFIRLSHPIAEFTLDDDEVCPGESIQFTDQTIPDTTIQSYLWDFGDGNTSAAQNPSHAYANPGTYTVSLTVTNVLACSDTEFKVDTITVVTPSNTQFNPSATAGCIPFLVDFTDTSIAGDQPILTWSWDFGDGTTSIAQNPSHTYTTPGTYTATLTTTDGSGCQVSSQVSIDVFGLPTAEFNALDRVGCAPENITFVDLSTGPAPIATWAWTFGDGGTSNAASPTYNYSADGLYDVSLLITDANGCVDSVRKDDYINLRRPTPDFTVNLTTICPGVEVQFTDTSIPDTTLTGWLWDFGDGNTSTAQNPTHTYTIPGDYDVTLTVTNLLSCSASTTQTNVITVVTPTTTQFTPSATSGCIPFEVDFTDTSIAGDQPIVSWSWDFGDGTSSIAQNPSHTYTTPGSYTALLTTTDGSGCQVSSQVTINVFGPPTAEFNALDRIGCSPENITFVDLSSGPAPIATWSWDFGDGGTSNAASPTHTYTADGLYDVSLMITDANGCVDSIRKDDYINLRRPTPDFTVNTNAVCPGLEVEFTDITVPDTTLVGWLWDFGDGATSTLQNPTHTYTASGNYNVSLTVTNLLNCSASITKANSVTIWSPPTADFTPSAPTGCSPLTVNFVNTSTGNSGIVVAYEWNFGDGTSSILSNPSHTYPTPGTYQVQLIATDNNGCPDTTVQAITVFDNPLTQFEVSDSVGCAPFTTSFRDVSTGPVPINAWLWDFGDGNTSTSPFPTHTYLNDGIYDVSLTVTDINGCQHTLLKSGLIRLSRPTTDFNVNITQTCPGTEVRFTDTSTPDTTLASWLWDFGDGNTSTDQNPVHLYAAQGTYSVSLTVTNMLGCSRTEIKTNFIDILQAPTPVFTPSVTEGCTPLNVVFTDASVGNSGAVVAWQWKFGDGTTATVQNPNHLYTNHGVYPAKLIVTDANGCYDSTEVDLTAWELPSVAFGASDSLGCAPQTITFEDESTSPYVLNNWAWDFGDGGTSNSQDPVYTYANDGVYTVSLVVGDQNGCRDTLEKVNYIRLSHPQSDFTSDVTSGCPGQAIRFSDTSTPDTVLNSWLWDFGDGNTSIAQNPTHVYQNPGVYAVSLTINNILGCGDVEVKTNYITIHTPPQAQFTPDVLQGCPPLDVNFTNNSVANSAPITNWNWDFDNGNTGIFVDESQTFTTPATYEVQLIATDGFGCRDTVTRDIEVFTPPVAVFVATDSLGCAPTEIDFLDQSTGTNPLNQWNWDFGDGGNSTIQSPSHTFTANGTFDVSLEVVDVNGCRDTLVRDNYIRLDQPVANFTVDNQLDCPGTTLQFTDTSVPDTTIANWLWDFGDGTTSNIPNPSHLYTTSGNYTVSLTITNVLGCSDTRVRNNVVKIFQGPNTNFVIADSIGCFPFVADFTDISVGNDAPVVGWIWDFGDGTSSVEQNPEHTYASPGTFTVSLMTTDNNGCSRSTSKTVYVLEHPTANFFTLDTLGCAPVWADFVDLSSGDFPIADWQWDFGDGGTSTDQNPTHVYTQDGFYTVSLIATDGFGCSDTAVKQEYIRLRNPQAAFDADERAGCPGLEVQFSDVSVPDTTIISWSWRFGDGNTSAAQNPSHVYNDPGDYQVELIITNILGCTDTMRMPNFIRIYQPPVASILPSATENCGPFSVTFTDASVSTQGIVQWSWSVDGTNFANSQNASYFFDEVGVYTVELEVTDSRGCTDTHSGDIEVFGIPEAEFTVSDSMGCGPVTLSFLDQTNASSQIRVWDWEFGEGVGSDQENPVYTYNQDGLYSVSLTVQDENGCIDSVSKENFIRLRHPEADFTVEYTPGCAPLFVNFFGESTGQAGIDIWNWSMGDGNVGGGQNVTHPYTLPGDYAVRLIAVDSLGCADTVTKVTNVNIIEDLVPEVVSIHHVSTLSDTSIQIMFAPDTDPNFEKYILYRESETQPGIYLPIDSTEFRNDTVFVDLTPRTTVRSYCYKVVSRNNCGSESSLLQTQEHCSVDILSVAIPDQVILEWNPYRGWQVDQYELYRVTDYNPFRVELIATLPGTETQYLDESTECFNAYSYRVKAVGSGALHESWSDTTVSFNQKTVSISTPDLLVRATVENDIEVLVEWQDFELQGEEILYLERQEEGGPWTTVATFPAGEDKYIDENVDVQNKSYSYRVSAQDSCGFRTDPSNIGKTVLMAAERSAGQNNISWSAYQGWKFGVDKYEIEVYNEAAGQYQLVDVVQGDITEYEDRTTSLDQGEYCYRIWAVELGNNRARSLSNEMCLPVLTNLMAPNAFTPNQDGINEVFTLNGIHVLTFNMQIYSRWGTLLYESNDITEGWDGTFEGTPVKEGVYVYIAKGVGFNGQPYLVRGTVTLLR
ncbi:MAG: PKD domain-containing protein [Bacteroidota bacterium]